MERKKSAIAVSFGDRLVYAVELLLLGSREANYRRIKRWILRCAEKQAEAWETSIEHFRKDHFDVRKLQEATCLTHDQIVEYSRNSKVNKGSVAVMQKLIAEYSLSSGTGKVGSRVWAPHMIAVALVGLDTTKLEQDWRFA